MYQVAPLWYHALIIDVHVGRQSPHSEGDHSGFLGHLYPSLSMTRPPSWRLVRLLVGLARHPDVVGELSTEQEEMVKLAILRATGYL